MKVKFLTLAAIAMFLHVRVHAQNVGINEDGSPPNPNAILDVKSFTKGVLIPRVSSAGRTAIPNTKGLLVYDTTVNSFWYNDGVTWQNMSGGGAGAGWSLTGNAGTTASNFIGTTDFQPLNIRVNNIPAGLIDPAVGIFNTYWGIHTGVSIHRDTAVANTGIGAYAQNFNTLGWGNASLGYQTLYTNTTGNLNVAVGAYALYANGAGQHNTSLGAYAMLNLHGGTGNTGLGAYTDVSSSTTNYINATAVGGLAIVNASNKVRIGNNAVTVVEGAAPYTVLSDGRFKFGVQEDVKGLDFIMQLRPVTYQLDVKKFDDNERKGQRQDKEAMEANEALRPAYDRASTIRRTGFIAQEVEQAAKKAGYNFSGVIAPDTEKDHYSLSYESFVVPLVKAMQEQQRIIEALQREVQELKQQRSK
jgi:hypothetical protein